MTRTVRQVLTATIALVMLMTAGCGDSGGTPLTTTTEPPTTSDQPTTSTGSTTTTRPAVPTTATPVDSNEPHYIVAGPNGVFEINGQEALFVLDRADVAWASSDGMGGLVFSITPGVIHHDRIDGGAAVIATDSSPNYVTLVGGVPTLEVSRLSYGDCDDADSSHAVLIDLTTGEQRIHVPCIPLESRGMHPTSIGGTLSVMTRSGGWPEEAAVWAELAFYPTDLPGWVNSVTDWDTAAITTFQGLEIAVAYNPWPDPCHWCGVSSRLSPDGRLLAIIEQVPMPANLGASSWAEFDALDMAEQWERWNDALVSYAVPARLRVIDLATGDEAASIDLPSVSWLRDFDGRYAVWEFGGAGHEGRFTADIHLLDTVTGLEIPINWGVPDAGSEPHTVTLALP